MSETISTKQLQEACAALTQTIEFIAASRLQKGRNPEHIASLFRKIQSVLDAKISEFQKTTDGRGTPCGRNTPESCHRVVMTTGIETLSLALQVDSTHDMAAKDALKSRLLNYLLAVGPTKGRALIQLRVQCPLLVDGNCSIFETRPIECRSRFEQSSQFATVEKEFGTAVQRGLQNALTSLGMWSQTVDMARVLGMTLNDMSLCAHYLSGHPMFELAAIQVDVEIVPPVPSSNGSNNYSTDIEPSGNPDLTVLSRSRYQLNTQGDPEAAFSTSNRDGALQHVFRMQTPMAYKDSTEIERWRARLEDSFDQFRERQFDLRDKFDAVAAYNPLSISYQQKDDLDLLSRIGDYLTDEIAAKVLPDLCAPMSKRKSDGRLRIGYIGNGLDKSSGGYWATGWLKNHAKDVETFVFYLNPGRVPGADEYQRLANHYFHLPGHIPDAARLIKQQNLDVLIYPDAVCEGRNIQFALLRLAPVQCACWGGPETTGLPQIDYFLSADWMEPENAQDHYREKLVRLPRTGICYPRPVRAGSGLSKAAFGLDEGRLLLCMQAPSKMLPEWDPIFKEICDRSGRPIVFFSYPNTAAATVENRFRDCGIKAVFMPFMNLLQFHDLISHADVVLDTVGWSGGITALLALEQGKPIVTLPGRFRRSRHTSAFLKAAGAEGLIATTPEEYVELVLDSDRISEAAVNLDPWELFEDRVSVTALEDFLREAVSQ